MPVLVIFVVSVTIFIAVGVLGVTAVLKEHRLVEAEKKNSHASV